MATLDQLRIDLPHELVEGIDQSGQERNHFFQDAVRNELARWTSEALRLSLSHPYPGAIEMAELGLDEWAKSLPDDEIDSMVEISTARPIRWLPGTGWVEGE